MAEMLVETFEVLETELAEHAPEMQAEAIELIESLGLKGQQTLLTEPEEGVAVERCPYRVMTAEEEKVYEEICPDIVALADYSAGPIPLRVLQVAAHAQSLGIMDKGLSVRFAGSTFEKDPLLLGQRSPPGSSYGTETFLLARWGEELEDFGVLAARAVQRWKEKILLKMDEKVRECEAFKVAVDSKAAAYFAGTWISIP